MTGLLIWFVLSFPLNWAVLWSGRKLAEKYGEASACDNNMALLGMWIVFSPITVFVTVVVATPLFVRFWFEAVASLINFDFDSAYERLGCVLFSKVEVRDVEADR